MTTVNNNATNAAGMCNPGTRNSDWGDCGLEPDQEIELLIPEKADNNNSSKDVYDDLSKMFKQDTELSQPVRQAVDSLVGELSGMKESVNDLLGQLVDKVKSGNPLSDLASPFSSENPMSSEEMSEVVSAVLSGLSGMSESTDELLGQLEGSIRDAISNPMFSDTNISDIAKAVLEGISGMSESADDLLGQLMNTVKIDSWVAHLPDFNPETTYYILPPKPDFNPETTYYILPPK
jgi:hypothetical protein